MTKIHSLLFLISIFFSCSPTKNKIPEGVLSKEKMVQVLTDVQVTEAALLLQKTRGMLLPDMTPEYYSHIFRKNRITEKQFRESFSYYVKQVDLMDKIYEEVINEISKKQAEVVNERQPSDSIY